ncbi:uncharacterized protein [Rutidosis leptorrhynchoides]|uniref:uncharacterized protein n=1 Tax=Rutidosis leptorrhynchoides TaxID=125765 RepID=UPI003A99F063
MFGLMRTTSRSESENAFFSNFTRSAANLLTFMDGFESAMLKQRSKQESLDAQTIKKNPKLLTQLKIEKHALKVYTHAIFAIVQREIYEALYSCLLDKMDKEEETEIYVVKEEKEKTKEGPNEEKKFFHYKVLHNSKDGSMVCTCRHYLRYGLLCRHCSDEKMLKVFLEKLKLLKKEVEAQVPKPSKKKDDIIGNMTGVSKPSTIEIQTPPVGNYKGCANDKHLMSGKEKAIKKSKKRKFTCGKCGRDDHNQRTHKPMKNHKLLVDNE